MRVVAAVEGWPGVPAYEARRIVEHAWRDAAPGIDVVTVLLGDGGPRSADSVAGPLRTIERVTAADTYEGLMLAPAGGAQRWDPTSLGSALRAIAASGTEAKRVIVPLGDAEPAGDATALWGASLVESRSALAGLDITALVGSDRPLLGFHGMSAAVREGREGDRALAIAAQQQEERWRARAAKADDVVAARELLASPRRLSDQPRTGAAGGLAYCLAALGARLEAASHSLASWAGLPEAVQSADVVVAVVDTLSHAALDHGATAPAGGLAAAQGVPAVVLTTDSHVGRRDLMAAGIHGAHLGDEGASGLADAVTRAARTWTPSR
ncbi:glycerate kinase [Demequina salsinemoris]|uniref:glycerate kinase n=1 Tax=Demequina salsinemoris TaxID=577470 RepID=UPI00078597D5|nr:glycerate kinase [Demequina salsinemoris]